MVSTQNLTRKTANRRGITRSLALPGNQLNNTVFDQTRPGDELETIAIALQ
ncbi:MAG: hypothetical protein WBA89_11295 [Microcoleus sp.]|uniref:hypothetical protein n=1 Tax=Microcoleaceae TaxID=1892252 RepID=UPI00187F9DDA|nr:MULTISPECIES: hypothetical protein [unclassified Tychonema]MBE9123847.1 hypothetical protein [Tychonema sp. LEGE 07199]MBE9131929.1 hypothetical protein [Tychonema sp. LEGE 07196]